MYIQDIFKLFVKFSSFVGLKHMCELYSEPVYTNYTLDYESEYFDLYLPRLRDTHILVYGQSFIKEIVDNVLVVNYPHFSKIQDIMIHEGDMCKLCNENASIRILESPRKLYLGNRVYYYAHIETLYYYARIFHFGINSTLTVLINSGAFQNNECDTDYNLEILKNKMGIRTFSIIFHNTPHPTCFFCDVQRKFLKKAHGICVDLTKPNKIRARELEKHGNKMFSFDNKWSCSQKHRCFKDGNIVSHMQNPYEHMCNPGLPTISAKEMMKTIRSL